MEDTLTRNVDYFISLCIENNILFNEFPHGKKQIKIFWQIFFRELLDEVSLNKVEKYIIDNDIKIFISTTTRVRDKLSIFVKYCTSFEIKFQSDSIYFEKLFCKVWNEYFNEKIIETQAIYYMSLSTLNSIPKNEFWLERDEVLEIEYKKVAEYYVIRNLIL